MRVRNRPLTIHPARIQKMLLYFLMALSKFHTEIITVRNEDLGHEGS